ncbi:hypothetical protein AB6A40_007656 [Gnathostoma spinigerum]|uniref:Potassium channel domain-containing protein n=1 Tax=Gnathostoma spinigerum TaxID=75299 RepID=A0ABD6EWJ0_9BILA
MKLATRYAIRIAQNLHSKLICAQNMIKERCSMSTKERTDISPEHQQRSDPFKRDIDRDSEVIEYHSAEAITEVDDRDVGEAIAFLITFIIYLLVGSLFLTLYEPEMDYFKAVYFNFVTLTTVGLGDVVPQSTKYLVVTFAYTTVGLALTTISMDIAANYLKQLHYFGRKLKDVEKAVVWFGGQRMTMKSLVKHLGDQFNVPIDQLESLDIGNFVDDAIKVEAGELKTLRKQVPAVSSVKSMHPVCFEDLRRSYESGSLRFVDDKTSTLNSGSELPLADDTARTISSGAPLPAVVEVTSLNSNDSYYGVSSEPFD